MTGKLEAIIKKQAALITQMELVHAADQELIDSQNHQLKLLQEKISLLEKEKQALTDAGNQMSAACERLDKICAKQQELLDSLSGISPQP